MCKSSQILKNVLPGETRGGLEDKMILRILILLSFAVFLLYKIKKGFKHKKLALFLLVYLLIYFIFAYCAI